MRNIETLNLDKFEESIINHIESINQSLIYREDRRFLFFLSLIWLIETYKDTSNDEGLCKSLIGDDFFNTPELDMVIGCIREVDTAYDDYIDKIKRLDLKLRRRFTLISILSLISLDGNIDDYIHKAIIKKLQVNLNL